VARRDASAWRAGGGFEIAAAAAAASGCWPNCEGAPEVLAEFHAGLDEQPLMIDRKIEERRRVAALSLDDARGAERY